MLYCSDLPTHSGSKKGGRWIGALLALFISLGCASHSVMTFKPLQPALSHETAGVRINYTHNILSPDDQRPVVVLLHGFGASLESWSDIYPELARERSVLRLDLKGAGFSSKPRDGKYKPEDQAHLVLGFLRDLKLRRVVLVGHSLGGGVAILAALQAQAEAVTPSIEGLVLIDTAGYPQPLPFFVSTLRNPILRPISRWMSPERRMKIVLTKIFIDQSRVTPERIHRYAYFMTLPGAEQALEETSKSLNYDSREALKARLAALKLPTLILWGGSDPVFSVSQSDFFHQAIPNSSISIVPGAGHVPQEERPQETLQILKEFLTSVR